MIVIQTQNRFLLSAKKSNRKAPPLLHNSLQSRFTYASMWFFFINWSMEYKQRTFKIHYFFVSWNININVLIFSILFSLYTVTGNYSWFLFLLPPFSLLPIFVFFLNLTKKKHSKLIYNALLCVAFYFANTCIFSLILVDTYCLLLFLATIFLSL